ncbi:hypothetical protein CEXT_277781 [Caerostris extrusa]|uniref:Uncharacterized protein n=1 Tax=Caerostris extrusa TaxID=172846 RepID=A0AAV4TRJ4_CAEEX|nr:hypothetical protein CEXT_277781 [Caerostris extrusa]
MGDRNWMAKWVFKLESRFEIQKFLVSEGDKHDESVAVKHEESVERLSIGFKEMKRMVRSIKEPPLEMLISNYVAP